ncbi:hypothetical protein Tco_0719159 [Tanacetum coccineum]
MNFTATSNPLESGPAYLKILHILAESNVEGENDTNTATKDPPSHTEGETDANRQEKSEELKHSIDANIELIGSSKLQPSITQAQPITTINPEPIIPQREGKGIATDEQVKDQRKLVKASSIIRPDPDALIPYTINGEKVEEEARLLAISKPKVIKVVQEEAENIRLDPKKIASDKAGTDGGNFDVHKPFAFGAFGISELDELREIIPRKKNAVVQDLMNSLSRRKKRKHMEFEPEIKIPRLECNRALPKNILFVNNIAISKPKVIKVLQEEAENIRLDPKKIASDKAGEKKHKFDNYMWTISSRLKFEIIVDINIHQKTKPVVITVYKGTDGRNFDVHKPFAFGAFGISELDELREIIPRKHNAVVQDLMNSLSRRYERIRKIPEELGIKSDIPALPSTLKMFCLSTIWSSKSLSMGSSSLYEFGDQAFQRWSDIDKSRLEALVSYLVAAFMVQSPENARFNMKLKKLIIEHHDQEKLKSKKVKLEALGYEMN